jgi:hypothetical protein
MKTQANCYAVDHAKRDPDNTAMSFVWGVSSGEVRYDNEPICLQAGFNDLYELFGYLEWSHSGNSRVRYVWLNGRMLMPVDTLFREFDGIEDFATWAKYAIPNHFPRH